MFGVDIHFKGGQTLKNILVSPKDKDRKLTVVKSTLVNQGEHLGKGTLEGPITSIPTSEHEWP